ncbi:MAG: potassium transporter TrkG [Bacillota bacterium]|nr:potassium transporter TrkG [Bacillota bacterium]
MTAARRETPAGGRQGRLHRLLQWIANSSTRTIVLSFALLILAGSLLLTLPVASRSGISIGYLPALFTATSCVCVTGLIVVDTATHWTGFGQLVIIMLIQAGGLGLVTITSFFLLATGRRLGMRSMLAVQESMGSERFADSRRLVWRIVQFTAGTELLGAILLVWRFSLRMPLAAALRRGVFQSISAFCNAGFDLMGDYSGPFSSLTTWNDDPVVLVTTGLLLATGGLGFVVWEDLLGRLRHVWRRVLGRGRERDAEAGHGELRFHTRLVLGLTLLLTLLGLVCFWLLEHDNHGAQGLGTLPGWQQPFAAWFQSVTLRTAGFNSIDQTGLTDASKLLGVMLMFIGAGPASTGGGIKHTTLAVIFAAAIANARGREETVLRRRTIPRAVVQRALVIFLMGITIFSVSSFLLAIIEEPAIRADRFRVIDLLYEVASAFGTVGVTSAPTSALQPLSHIVLIACMFLGRVGPASFAMGLAQRRPQHSSIVWPEGRTYVG